LFLPLPIQHVVMLCALWDLHATVIPVVLYYGPRVVVLHLHDLCE